MRPLYVTETPTTFRLQFDYNPRMVDCVKRIPQRSYDRDDKVWVIKKSTIDASGRDARWYVQAFSAWAVSNHLVTCVRQSVSETDVIIDIPEMADIVGEHYMQFEPYQYQREGVQYALTHQRCLFGDQPGLGKEQPLSSPIYTPDGEKRMGDIKVGDLVFGCDGKAHKVTGVFPQGVKPVYRITFNDGVSTLAGYEHLWTVRDVNMRRRGKGWAVKTTRELVDAGLEYGCSEYRKNSGRKPVLKWEIPMCMPVEYETKEYFIHPYILGAFIGDGCMYGSTPVLTNPDIDGDIHERIASLVSHGYELKSVKHPKVPHYSISKNGERPNKYMAEFDRLELKVRSENKRIPDEYLYGDIQQRKDLLAGLMDTDGSISKGAKMCYCTTSERLAHDVAMLVHSLGGQAKVSSYEREDKKTEYRTCITMPFNPFYTKRKRDAYLIRKSNYNSRYIKSVEYVGEEECQCIYVDSEEHTYLTDSYIVTHNTMQAICAVVKAHKEAASYGETFPTLVICPASLKVNWQREFKKFAGIQSLILADENKDTWQRYIEMKKSNGENMCDVFITNYESLKKFFVRKITPGAKLTMRNIVFDERVKLFKSVIIDESHKCKCGKTQQAKFVEGICKGKRWVFALTGTPVVNNNTDLIQQLKILDRLGDFGGYAKFVERYCDGPNQNSHIKELNGKLWQNCFFRREKQKVLTQLPEKTRQYISVPITNQREYDDAERDMLNYLREYKNADDDKVMRAMRGAVMVKMGLLKQIAAKGKIKAVSDFVHDIIDGGEKLILFAYLKEVVEALKKEFPKAVTVTGSDSVAEKQRAVDMFQEDESCKLIILNYKSGGTGLTLTAASRVAFIEFPWTYSDCEQAEDRAHRNGQKNNVNCYYFLGDKTIDEYMYKIIQTKREIADGVTGTETQIEEDVVKMAMDLFSQKL